MDTGVAGPSPFSGFAKSTFRHFHTLRNNLKKGADVSFICAWDSFTSEIRRNGAGVRGSNGDGGGDDGEIHTTPSLQWTSVSSNHREGASNGVRAGGGSGGDECAAAKDQQKRSMVVMERWLDAMAADVANEPPAEAAESTALRGAAVVQQAVTAGLLRQQYDDLYDNKDHECTMVGDYNPTTGGGDSATFSREEGCDEEADMEIHTGHRQQEEGTTSPRQPPSFFYDIVGQSGGRDEEDRQHWHQQHQQRHQYTAAMPGCQERAPSVPPPPPAAPNDATRVVNLDHGCGAVTITLTANDAGGTDIVGDGGGGGGDPVPESWPPLVVAGPSSGGEDTTAAATATAATATATATAAVTPSSSMPSAICDGFHPYWLVVLSMDERFFQPCPTCNPYHPGGRDSLVTYLDVTDPYRPGVCSYCRSARLKEGHRLLQVRRSTYHEVVQVADVMSLVDLEGIQLYTINHARVVFLRGRPQARPPKGLALPSRCLHDGRQLMDAVARYCCLRCKMECEPESIMYDRNSPAAAAVLAYVGDARRRHVDDATGDVNGSGGGSAAGAVCSGGTVSAAGMFYRTASRARGGTAHVVGVPVPTTSPLPPGTSPPLAASDWGDGGSAGVCGGDGDAGEQAITEVQMAGGKETGRRKRRRTEAEYGTSTTSPRVCSLMPVGSGEGGGGDDSSPVINLARHCTAGPSSSVRRAQLRHRRRSQLQVWQDLLPVPPYDDHVTEMTTAMAAAASQALLPPYSCCLGELQRSPQPPPLSLPPSPAAVRQSNRFPNASATPCQSEFWTTREGHATATSAATAAGANASRQVAERPPNLFACGQQPEDAAAVMATTAAAASSSAALGGYDSEDVDGRKRRRQQQEVMDTDSDSGGGCGGKYDKNSATGLLLLGPSAVSPQERHRHQTCLARQHRHPHPPLLLEAATTEVEALPLSKSPGRHARFGPAPAEALGGVNLLEERRPFGALVERRSPSPHRGAVQGLGTIDTYDEEAAARTAAVDDWTRRQSSSRFVGGGDGDVVVALEAVGLRDRISDVADYGCGGMHQGPELTEYLPSLRSQEVAAVLPKGGRRSGSLGSGGGIGSSSSLRPLPGPSLAANPLSIEVTHRRPHLPSSQGPLHLQEHQQQQSHAHPVLKLSLSLPNTEVPVGTIVKEVAVAAAATAPQPRRSPGLRRSSSRAGAPPRGLGRGGGGGDSGAVRTASRSSSAVSLDSGGDTRSSGSPHHTLPQPHSHSQQVINTHHNKRKSAPRRSALE